MTTIHHGDCIEVMRGMADDSVDAIVTDPPYGLGFMGKKWDALPPGEEWAAECLRVLKPGGHLLSFGGTRTWHRLAVAVEDAGFEIRDSIAWMYGSGFPKSLDVSKAIDKIRDDYPAIREVVAFIRRAYEASGTSRATLDEALGGSAVMSHFLAMSRSNAGCPTWEQWNILKGLLVFGDEMDAEVWRLNGRKGTPGEAFGSREVIGSKTAGMGTGETFGMLQSEGRNVDVAKVIDITAPATEAAQEWQGWGTALKPAFEPVVVARKPLTGTVAQNVLQHRTGALNIDACRIGTDDTLARFEKFQTAERVEPAGRWPANVALDENMAAVLDGQSGVTTSNANKKSDGRVENTNEVYGHGLGRHDPSNSHSDSGGASRFFYVAKAPKKERPTYTPKVLRLREGLTQEQVDHVQAQLQAAGVSPD